MLDGKKYGTIEEYLQAMQSAAALELRAFRFHLHNEGEGLGAQVGDNNDLVADDKMDISILTDRKTQKKCYSCGRAGHLRKDCRTKKKERSDGKPKTKKFCSFCHRAGHAVSDCWKRKSPAATSEKNSVAELAENMEDTLNFPSF